MHSVKLSSDPSTPTSTATTITKRACDSCHRRKVKCIPDGLRACQNCVTANLTCTYNAIPQKKGPKGNRARVISELRETQRSSGISSPDPLSRRQGTPHSPNNVERNLSVPISIELIMACADFFFDNLYPTQAIMHRQRIGETIGLMETNVEAYCLILSLCAYTLIQPNIALPSGVLENVYVEPQTPAALGAKLLQEVLRARKTMDLTESPNTRTVITSFFLFGCHFGQNRCGTAWFHLREATTFALLTGMNDESTYTALDPVESSCRRRLYWLLFVTERATALRHNRPLSLHASIKLPKREDDPMDTVHLAGFLQLIALYRPFDDAFLAIWTRTRTGVTMEELAHLHHQLSKAVPRNSQSTETQKADLLCSRYWLHIKVWQLTVTESLTSDSTTSGPFSLKYPIEIARDVLAGLSHFSQHAMEVHGIGFVGKLFDIACALKDAMKCSPLDFAPASDSMYGSHDCLTQLVKLITTLRGGRQCYGALLQAKLSDTLQPPSSPYTLPTFNGAYDESIAQAQAHAQILQTYTPPATSSPATSSPFRTPMVISSAHNSCDSSSTLGPQPHSNLQVPIPYRPLPATDYYPPVSSMSFPISPAPTLMGSTPIAASYAPPSNLVSFDYGYAIHPYDTRYPHDEYGPGE